jgi:hypothetical protein
MTRQPLILFFFFFKKNTHLNGLSLITLIYMTHCESPHMECSVHDHESYILWEIMKRFLENINPQTVFGSIWVNLIEKVALGCSKKLRI